MSSRISRIDQMLIHAQVAALRSTCKRRHTGAVITDPDGIVLGIGYNGTAQGTPHCIETPCDKVDAIKGSDCDALHAEWNAIMFCENLREAHAIYCTTSPCFSCMKMLANSPIMRIFYIDRYHDWEQVETYWQMVLHRRIEQWVSPSLHIVKSGI